MMARNGTNSTVEVLTLSPDDGHEPAHPRACSGYGHDAQHAPNQPIPPLSGTWHSRLTLVARHWKMQAGADKRRKSPVVSSLQFLLSGLLCDFACVTGGFLPLVIFSLRTQGRRIVANLTRRNRISRKDIELAGIRGRLDDYNWTNRNDETST